MSEHPDSEIERLFLWERGQAPGPWEITLFPTNRCNQRCKMCWQRWIESRDGKLDLSEVPDERLLRLVDEAAEMGVREWAVSGGGEPFTRADLLMRFLERIRSHGMDGRLHTNAVRLTPEYMERLVKSDWRQVNVSLDGPDAVTNDAIRSTGAFERATANIRTFNEVKAKLGRSRPKLSINAVVTNLNFDKMDGMVRLAHELQCELGLFVSALAVHDSISAEFQLTDDQRFELPSHFDRALALARELGVPNNLETLRTPERSDVEPPFFGNTEGIVGDGRLSDAVCFEAWLTATILPDGRIGPCCMFWDEGADRILDRSLRDVWTGPYLQQVRERLRQRKGLPSYCRSCHSHIAVRTRQFREGLLARERIAWSEASAFNRARYLVGRTATTLMHKGWRETLHRAGEWLKTRR